MPQVGYLVAVQEHEVHFLDHVLPPPPRATQGYSEGGEFLGWDITYDPRDEFGHGGSVPVVEPDGLLQVIHVSYTTSPSDYFVMVVSHNS